MIVVDASVVAKWYLPERGTEAALELMTGRNQLIAPDLIRLEVLSALTRRVKRREATRSEVESQCEQWLGHLDEGAVSLVPEADLLRDAVDLSLKVVHPIQDCLYLALARQRDVELVTADRPFHERARSIHERVSLLPGCQGN